MAGNFDASLPLFVYGALQPGELAWPFLKPMVVGDPKTATLEGFCLVLVDGVPTVMEKTHSSITGSIVHLKDEQAFERIGTFEDVGRYYRWAILMTDQGLANVLCSAGEPDKPTEIYRWTSADDIYFGSAVPFGFGALTRLRTSIYSRNVDGSGEVEDFLELQSLYGLYWTLFERLLLFTTGAPRKFPGDSNDRETLISRLRNAQKNNLWQAAVEKSKVERISCSPNDEPYDREKRKHASKAPLETWYCLRNNVIHRGKGAPREVHKLLKACIDFHNTLAWFLQDNNESIRLKWETELTSRSEVPYSDGLYVLGK